MVSYYLIPLSFVHFLSPFIILFSSLYYLRQTPCSFSHYVCLCSFPFRLVLAFCRKCQHGLTQTDCLAAAFPFFIVKQRPGWAAGGHSHTKITMSHPGDLCMCQRVQSRTPHQPTCTHAHTHTPRWRHTITEVHNVSFQNTLWDVHKGFLPVFPMHILACSSIMSSVAKINVTIERCLLTKPYSFLYSLILSNVMCVSAVYPGMAY